MKEYFYHKSIRVFSSVLGSLLNEIKVKKEGRYIDVPLQYAGQDKFRAKIAEQSTTQAKIKNILPKMSYKLTGWNLDKKRKRNKLNKIQQKITPELKENGNISSQYERVPYNFFYTLKAKTKTIDELLQITEQVISYFDPFIDINIDGGGYNEDIVRIILESGETEDDNNGSFESARNLEATFHFILEGWIYKNKTNSKIIKKINLDFSTNENYIPADLGYISIDENENITIIDE